MRKATRRKSYSTAVNPVAIALLNRQTADAVLVPRIREHDALSAFEEGRADCDDYGQLCITADTGLRLSGFGVEPESRPLFVGACELLERMHYCSSATPTELELLRRMVAAHDRQREQIGRGDYLKALKRP
jgi:hypothetical protein